MLAAEWTDTGTYLVNVRRPEGKERERFRDPDEMFYLVGKETQLQSHWMKLPTWKTVTSRQVLGSMPGCSNRLWEVSQEEWDTLIAEDAAQHQPPSTPTIPEPLPENVQTLLKRYKNSDAAWDDENETGWALLRQYDL